MVIMIIYKVRGYSSFQPQAKTLTFSTLDFSTINSSTLDSYGVKKFMAEWSGIDKSGVEMSCYLLVPGHFTPGLILPWTVSSSSEETIQVFIT